jgi:hypothetical protein
MLYHADDDAIAAEQPLIENLMAALKEIAPFRRLYLFAVASERLRLAEESSRHRFLARFETLTTEQMESFLIGRIVWSRRTGALGEAKIRRTAILDPCAIQARKACSNGRARTRRESEEASAPQMSSSRRGGYSTR